jgi:hypothetical protein
MGRGRKLDICGDSTLRSLVSQVSARAAPAPYLNYSAREAEAMPLFLYRCPTTGYRVQDFSAEYVSEDTYEPVLCVICKQVHVVNPATGAVLGEGSEQVTSRPGRHR